MQLSAICVTCFLLLSPSVFALDIDSKLLAPFGWREIGPTATGGRIVDLEVDPTRTSTLYVASASGGLWKSDNNGTTWSCLFQSEGTTSIGDIAVDPQDPQTLWIGSGEANNQRSSYWGDGVYKSSDGGATWNNVGLRDTHHIGRVVVDPTNSAVVYVAALGHLYSTNEERGLFKTTDGGKTWNKVLYVNDAVGVVDVVLDPSDPQVIFAASYERLRRAWDFDGAGPGSAIYKSNDGGESWRKLEGGLPTGEIGRIGLAIYPKNPKIVYATVSDQNIDRTTRDDEETDDNGEPEDRGLKTPFGFSLKYDEDVLVVSSVSRGSAAQRGGVRDGSRLVAIAGTPIKSEFELYRELTRLQAGDEVRFRFEIEDEDKELSLRVPAPGQRQVGGGIFRSDNSGVTWTKQNDRPVGGSPAYYYGQIRVDPQDSERLYVMSVPLSTSKDGGKEWESIARSVHVDHHALWIDPNDSEHLILGNDGGLHFSWDRGKTWDHVFNLPLAQFYAVGVDMQWPYHIYGGTQDNGSWGGPSQSRNPGGIGRFEWYRCGGGDGFYVQIDPNDSNIIYSESQFGGIRRVDRHTGRSVSIRPPQSDPGGARDRYNWNSPIALSHFDSRVVYFGGNKLFKSYNQGDDWVTISPDLSNTDPTRLSGNVPHCTITTFSESKLDKNLLLVGTDDGNVQWTDDGGKSWVNLSDRMPIRPPSWWCSRVQLSAHSKKVAYVSFTGYREDDFRPFLFATRDSGKTWQTITGNLPEGPINVIIEDPVQKNLLYVGTEFGVFASFDRGENWIPLTEDMPRIAVHDLVVHPREMDLVAASHARGFFILDDITPLQELADAVEKDVHLFPVRRAVTWMRKRGLGISGNRRVMAPNPRPGTAISYSLASDVEKLSLRILDADGKEVGKLNTEGKHTAGLHRVQWDLRRGRRGSVDPGRYQAELKVGESTFLEWIEVVADPLSTP